MAMNKICPTITALSAFPIGLNFVLTTGLNFVVLNTPKFKPVVSYDYTLLTHVKIWESMHLHTVSVSIMF